jgi:predicted nucleotidyltransferase component of viral defense system
MVDPDILRHISVKTGLGLKYLSKDEKVSIVLEQVRGLFSDDLRLRLEAAKENSYYIGNCANHFIPKNLRPDWNIFIDTLISKVGRTF